ALPLPDRAGALQAEGEEAVLAAGEQEGSHQGEDLPELGRGEVVQARVGVDEVVAAGAYGGIGELAGEVAANEHGGDGLGGGLDPLLEGLDGLGDDVDAQVALDERRLEEGHGVVADAAAELDDAQRAVGRELVEDVPYEGVRLARAEELMGRSRVVDLLPIEAAVEQKAREGQTFGLAAGGEEGVENGQREAR